MSESYRLASRRPKPPPPLIAFLYARIGEDEAAAKAWLPFGNPDAAAREHVARLDPARVLAEVGAFRAILALHKTEVVKADIYRYDPCTGERNPDEYEVTCEICGWAGDDPSSACPTLRHLAAIWSDHSDYRENWKP